MSREAYSSEGEGATPGRRVVLSGQFRDELLDQSLGCAGGGRESVTGRPGSLGKAPGGSDNSSLTRER